MKASHLSALCVCTILSTVSIEASAAAISGQGTWETTLQARSFDGGATIGGYYDTDLNITWLANANAAVGSAYDTYSRGSGEMDWMTANTWAASLNLNGIGGWRLPTTVDVGNDGCNAAPYYQGVDCDVNITTPSEMSHMFYATLGDKARYDTSGNPQAGAGKTNTGPFSNLQDYPYWSATEYAPNTSYAWEFSFYYGDQSYGAKTNTSYAWAVHAGDVGLAVVPSVPVPAAVWLFGSGLLGLLGVSGKRRR